ncbi:pectinesterase 3 [Phoenix dactylifera]|uniref:Pectinesterase 3 n=1 Tax=Phoenix dactylifera TaxID=42345 RepID=A0A8B8JA73_PHODC|nr:pectinesterase 3 [Phoenix dactylifera]
MLRISHHSHYIISTSEKGWEMSYHYTNTSAAAFGAGLILQDLKIENKAGPHGVQAVALLVAGDQSVINRCGIEGYHDTLYAHNNRQFYRDSWISGTVDVIFGNAAAAFQNCQIFARKPLNGHNKNTITAQGRICPTQNSGMSFQDCQVLPADDLKPVMGSVRTYLGRPWRTYARVVFMQSFLAEHIDPKGYISWNAGPDTVYYGEYQNWGPGANTKDRVKWPGCHSFTDSSEVEDFTVARLIQGDTWLKYSGVPYKVWF